MSAKKAFAIPAEIAAIVERLHTQDNRITADPLFAVQQKRIIGGVGDDYTDAFAWIGEEGIEAGQEESAALDALHDAGEPIPDGWLRVGYVEKWEFVTGCLTEQGCKDYIARNGHNLKEPRIYAYGSYRNAEWKALREWLMSLAAAPAQAVDADYSGAIEYAEQYADAFNDSAPSRVDIVNAVYWGMRFAYKGAPIAAQEVCFCDKNNLGEPGVSCGDCPTRDYKGAPTEAQEAPAAPAESAPSNSLPDWDECALRVSNSEFIAKRVAEGGYGAEPDSLLATELHRFIYEYDDADPYSSGWFLHRLELLLEETKRAALAASPAAAPPEPPAELFDGYAVFKALSKQAQQRTSPENVADVLDAVARLMRAASPAAQPERLKDEEISDLWRKWVGTPRPNVSFARAIESAVLTRAATAPADIGAMVNRFLGWKLPHTFSPDAGVKFTPSNGMTREDAYEKGWWPTGTNLLNADEARAMLEYALAASPVAAPPEPTDTERDALLTDAARLCDWIEESPHQRGSINGAAAQLRHSIARRAALTAFTQPDTKEQGNG